MSGPLMIEKVKIAAFRGVTTPLELDFTAPVTVVFAPNGTGKTTFCEAIEWLLTGQVERLRDGPWSNDVLNSKFLKDISPTVEAEFRIGDQPHRMWRTTSGAWLDHENGKARRPGDLLQFLAPAAAAPDRHHVSAIRLRQHYLRGTRFLTSEALAALVDNTPSSLERRKDVFADLLGIRHLRDAEQASAKFVAELAPTLRDLEATSQRLSDEAAELRKEAQVAEASAQATVDNLLAAERLINLERASGNIDARLQAVAAAFATARHQHARQTEGLDQLAAVWTRRPELQAHIEGLQKAEPQALAAATAAQTARQAAERVVTERQSTEQQGVATLGKLSAAAELLRARLGDVLNAVAFAEPYLAADPPTLAGLVGIVPEVSWDDAARIRKRLAISEAVAAEPRVDQVLSEQADLARRRGALEAQLPSAESLQTLRLVAEEGEASAARALSDAEALAGPLAALQSAGKSVVDHQHEADAACPLCGHDWQERDSLVAAVDAALRAAPSLITAARTVADNATAAAAAARRAYDQAQQLRLQWDRLGREAQALDERLIQDRKLLETVDAPISGDERRTVLDWAERRLNLAQALADLSAGQTANLDVVTEEGVRFLPRNMAIRQVPDALASVLDQRRLVLEERLTRARDALTTARAGLVNMFAAERSEGDKLAALRRDLAKAQEERSSIDSLWASLAGEEAWTADGLERLRNEARIALAKIVQAEAHLAAAHAAWDSEMKHRQLAAAEAELTPVVAKIERLKGISTTAEAMRIAFQESYFATSQAQVGGLSRVVNALFLRMHANRVVDRIDLGQSDSFLEWLADAGESHLVPGRDFSQGQRQDLALALFLARARGLGGTFFLDEPVAHLDDLNRVGLMDVFRAVALEGAGRVRLVITTASRSFARHMVEKFGAVAPRSVDHPAMRVIELIGNGRVGVTQAQVFPLAA